MINQFNTTLAFKDIWVMLKSINLLPKILLMSGIQNLNEDKMDRRESLLVRIFNYFVKKVLIYKKKGKGDDQEYCIMEQNFSYHLVVQ